MSGHSKWHKVKRLKEVTDKKKGQLFGRFAREIVIAARTEPDPAKNSALRDAIARAKKANMPQANIDRLLQNKNRNAINEMTYEGFGPGGIAVLVVAHTDNPNRTVAEVRTLFKNHGGQLGAQGSVRWKFDEHMQPAFPQAPADKETLTNLIQALENHPDVVQVHTDALD